MTLTTNYHSNVSLRLVATLFGLCLHHVACLPPSVPEFPRGAIVTSDYTTGGCIRVYSQYWREETLEGRAGEHNSIVSANFVNLHTNPASGMFDCEETRDLVWTRQELRRFH